jgi:trehalose synthase
VQKVTVGILDPSRFSSVLPEERFGQFASGIRRAKELLDGRRVWNINSTAQGGGVAEMLRSLLAYARGMDLDVRWAVMEGREDFFRVTKRIHNHLHGYPGDGGDLDEEEHGIYDAVTAMNAAALEEMVAPDDVVIVHDPQPAGLVENAQRLAAGVLWRCHVGIDMPNELARNAWNFLIPYVQDADRYVFSRRAFGWEGLDASKMLVIPPSIDAFSAKNQEMSRETVGAILRAAGIMPDAPAGEPAFLRESGERALIERRAHYLDDGDPPSWNDPIVMQVSRWDRLKDPVGVILGFGEYVAPTSDAHLILAGPATEAVSDDPEGLEVIEEAREAWRRQIPDVRRRIHLLSLPMDDGEENAAMVNALQRRSDVVVQKSIAEGFGLTVTEAMWKGRPVVASGIGGIQDQIRDGETGLLLHDPKDLEEFGAAVTKLLNDPIEAERVGRAAQRYVIDHFLGSRHLLQWLNAISAVIEPDS